MDNMRVNEKTLELLRTRLLNAVKKEAMMLVAEKFGSPEDIDRNFKSLFHAELGPHEMAIPDRTMLCNDKKPASDVIEHGPTSFLGPKISVNLVQSIRDNLVGVWSVLEFSMVETSNRNQKIHPWGPTLEGQMIFTSDGFINGVVAIPGQAPFGGDEPWTAGAAELAESARRTCSYSGKFSIELTSLGPALCYEIETCNYPVFRELSYRVFIDFTKKSNQHFLITTLFSNVLEDVSKQKQEVWLKISEWATTAS